VCTENPIPVGARQNHLPSERDDRPDVLLPFSLPLRSKIRFEAENAILRHQLIVLEREIRGAFASPIAIASSSFGSIVGFPQCWMRFGSPDPRPWCGRTVPVFDVTDLEVPIDRWSATNQRGSARVDPTDEASTIRCARSTYPRRIAEDRLRRCSVERGEVHD
jgi:hypothetical protein